MSTTSTNPIETVGPLRPSARSSDERASPPRRTRQGRSMGNEIRMARSSRARTRTRDVPAACLTRSRRCRRLRGSDRAAGPRAAPRRGCLELGEADRSIADRQRRASLVVASGAPRDAFSRGGPVRRSVSSISISPIGVWSGHSSVARSCTRPAKRSCTRRSSRRTTCETALSDWVRQESPSSSTSSR